MFNNLDVYLSSKFSVDYWSDEGISVAVEKLLEFKSGDWLLLGEAVDNRSEDWRVRCAEALGDVSYESLNVLLKLLCFDNSEVKISVLDSISSLIVNGLSVEDSRNKINEAIRGVGTESPVVNMMIESLKTKL